MCLLVVNSVNADIIYYNGCFFVSRQTSVLGVETDLKSRNTSSSNKTHLFRENGKFEKFEQMLFIFSKVYYFLFIPVIGQ